MSVQCERLETSKVLFAFGGCEILLQNFQTFDIYEPQEWESYYWKGAQPREAFGGSGGGGKKY